MAKITSETALFSTGSVNLYIHGRPFSHSNVNPFLFRSNCSLPFLSSLFFVLLIFRITCRAICTIVPSKRSLEIVENCYRFVLGLIRRANANHFYCAIYHGPRCFIRRDWLMSLLPVPNSYPKNYPISTAVHPPPEFGRRVAFPDVESVSGRGFSLREKSGNHKSPSTANCWRSIFSKRTLLSGLRHCQSYN